MKIFAVLNAVLVTILSAYATEPRPIPWRSGESKLGHERTVRAAPYAVIQFSSRPNSDCRVRLQASGIRLLTYLSADAWIARVDAKAWEATEASIIAMEPMRPEWKMHPLLRSGEFLKYSQAEGKDTSDNVESTRARTTLYVQFHADVALEPIARQMLQAHNGVVLNVSEAIQTIVADVPRQEFSALANEDAVLWIEPALPELTAVNDGNRVLTQVDVVQEAPYGLDGAGVRVMLYDAGSADASHPDFGGRLTQRDSEGLESHPTHVAGTIGGSGINSALRGGQDRQWRGMAPGVLIESFSHDRTGPEILLYTDPGDIESSYVEAIQNLHADIANNSIGANVTRNELPCGILGDYGLVPALIDEIVRGALGSPITVVWSAGNERGQAFCNRTYSSISPPATAKNSIVVGAVLSNNDVVTTFSSFGPTDDGRVKPDVTAPGGEAGGGVTSTEIGGGYSIKQGTSMAAPTVTGVCALLLQDYRLRFGSGAKPANDPLNSTLKCLLIHTAADLGQPGPDYQYGFGSVRAKDAIDFMRLGHFLESEIADNHELDFASVVGPDQPLIKATLVWDDVPAASNVIPALVNDLDLELVSPSGATHYPWAPDPNNPSAAAAQTAPDRINNVEQVLVASPEVGVWRIRVKGYSVPVGPQRFSLAVTPNLFTCVSAGAIHFSADAYGCDSLAEIVVSDCDLDADPNSPDSVTIHAYSASDPIGQALDLTETAASSGVFKGTIPLGSVTNESGLLVNHGDTITAEYRDAMNGQGAESLVSATSNVDCAPPEITLVGAFPGAIQAYVGFTTNEPARSQARYGASCDLLDLAVENNRFLTTHLLLLTGLHQQQTHHYTLSATDNVGNTTVMDNDGSCFQFTTGSLADYFSELFGGGLVDVEHGMLMLFPDNSGNAYRAEFARNVMELPTDYRGGHVIAMNDDDAKAVTLPDGKTVRLYGVAYDTIYVGSNGFISFDLPNSSPTTSFLQHFEGPRMSAFHMDIDVSESSGAGSVTWKRDGNLFAVSWFNAQQWDKPELHNTFQIRMHDNGRIDIAWVRLDSEVGLAGISAGNGEPSEYLPSDLSEYPLSTLLLHPITDKVVFEGTVLSFLVGADGPHGAPSLSLSGAPPSAVFEDRSDGTARFTWDVPYGIPDLTYEFQVTVSDGESTESRSFRITVITNAGAPPIASNLTIAPASPHPWEDLHGAYAFTDPEGRPEGATQIKWYRNDALVDALTGSLFVSKNLTRGGDAWRFTVTPNDGRQFGVEASSSTVVVRNSADIDDNQRIDAVDVQLAINAVLAIGAPIDRADVNTDGAIDSIDVMLVIIEALE